MKTHSVLATDWERYLLGDAYWAESNIGDENAESGAKHFSNISQLWSAADRVLEVLRGSCEVNAIELS